MAKLTDKRVQAIEDMANDLLRTTFELPLTDIKFPLDLNRLLEHSELTLKSLAFSDPVSGAYRRASSEIYVDPRDPAQRQAFTIAHELGHHYLHTKVTEDVLYRRDTDRFNGSLPPEETEANWFAASLLMPSDVVYYLNSYVMQGSVRMAEFFGVSLLAMRWRLENLGLLEKEQEHEAIRP